jgi:hypothetical protein
VIFADGHATFNGNVVVHCCLLVLCHGDCRIGLVVGWSFLLHATVRLLDYVDLGRSGRMPFNVSTSFFKLLASLHEIRNAMRMLQRDIPVMCDYEESIRVASGIRGSDGCDTMTSFVAFVAGVVDLLCF